VARAVSRSTKLNPQFDSSIFQQVTWSFVSDSMMICSVIHLI
jgi:hypothetical protein